jgi:hypothetical protein
MDEGGSRFPMGRDPRVAVPRSCVDELFLEFRLGNSELPALAGNHSLILSLYGLVFGKLL